MKRLLFIVVLIAVPALAQEHMHHEGTMHDAVAGFLMRQASGTSMNPAAAPAHMHMIEAGDWLVMVHGSAFLNQVWQSGPRGGDKLFSTNWVMGMADRKLAGGHLMLRSMLSLEPATITDRSYPELFQTGETAFGQPLRDGQHPHDFFMELAAEYAVPIDAQTIGYLYLAPVGDPSLGPVAYPHRASALEIPQATLGHHIEDSTHIAMNVVTVGMKQTMFGAALSAFHGAEPDEHRWDIEGGRIDSWAVRVTADPTPNWTAQISTGHLKKPEALEPGDIQRTTASVGYSTPAWSSSLIFGRNDKQHGPSTNAWTAETLYQLAPLDWVTARLEVVDKDELAESGVHRIKALTAGYTRDVWSNAMLTAGAGVNLTIYDFPAQLEGTYGRNPRALYLYARVRSH
ncbi:MAG TPA: hypothetical protein VLV78_12980 [Thermoanaerobaculia bacterium]|nr:hypothetical protein [Thermoanaerobaculia bacterium]